MPLTPPSGLRTFGTDSTAGPTSAGATSFGDGMTLLGSAAGQFSGTFTATTDDVIAIGVMAAVNNKSPGVVVIGNDAAPDLQFGTGVENDGTIAIGHGALELQGTDQGAGRKVGLRNIAIGTSALGGVSGDGVGQNVVIGHLAGSQVTPDRTGAIPYTLNVFIGEQAGENIRTATGAVAIGRAAMQSAQVADSVLSGPIAIGSVALAGITSGNAIAIGQSAASVLSTGSGVYIGRSVASALTTGIGNVFLGDNAGDSCIAGAENVLIGNDAAGNATGVGSSVCIGANCAASLSGLRHVVIGHNANATASDVVAIGSLAFAGGADDVCIGQAAGSGADLGVPGGSNVFIGADCGNSNSTAARNVAIGAQAMPANIDGAVDNVVLGHGAAPALTSGVENVLIGSGAGALVAAHLGIVAIGAGAGPGTGVASWDGSILIGRGAGLSAGSLGSQFIVEDDDSTVGFLWGHLERANLVLGKARATADRDFKSGHNIFKLQPAAPAPAANPNTGVFLYVDATGLKCRGSAGTITPLAPL